MNDGNWLIFLIINSQVVYFFNDDEKYFESYPIGEPVDHFMIGVDKFTVEEPSLKRGVKSGRRVSNSIICEDSISRFSCVVALSLS